MKEEIERDIRCIASFDRKRYWWERESAGSKCYVESSDIDFNGDSSHDGVELMFLV